MDGELALVLHWLWMVFVVTALAKALGRSVVRYFAISIILSPFLGIVILFFWAVYKPVKGNIIT